MGKRGDKRDRIEQTILDLSARTIAETGIEGLRIAELAKMAGLSVGGLYRYYDSKSAILAALGQRAVMGFVALQTARLAELEQRLGERSSKSPTAALARVLVAVETYLVHAQREPWQHGLLDRFLSAPTPLLTDDEAKTLELHLAPLLERTSRLIDDAVDVGALTAGNATIRTLGVWMALHGSDHFVKRDRLTPATYKSGIIIREVIDWFLHAWGARPATLTLARRL